MSRFRRSALLALVALAGIAIAAAVTWGTSQLVRQHIGLSSEPLAAGSSLVAPAGPRTAPARTAPARTTAPAAPAAPAHIAPTSPAPAAVPAAPAAPAQAAPSAPPPSERRTDGGAGGASSRDSGEHRDD